MTMNKTDLAVNAISTGILRERLIRGLSRSQVSELSGVPLEVVEASEGENAGEVDIVLAAKLTRFFNVTFTQLERQAA